MNCNIKILWKFDSCNDNPVELIQDFDCKAVRIQCYNLTDCKSYVNDYGIVVYNKRTKISSYAYFINLEDMFIYYDILYRHFNFIA